MKGKARTFGIIIGLVIGMGTVGMIMSRGGFARAGGQDRPLDVTVTPESPNTVSIKWSTSAPSQGVILYSTKVEGPWDSASVAPEETQTTNHEKELTLLQAGMTYFFKIKVGATTYDNDGIAWSFTTPNEDGIIINPSTSPQPRKPLPSPIQHLVIPDTTTTTSTTAPSCDDTDCAKIKAKFSSGCTTQDYIRCLRKQSGQ